MLDKSEVKQAVLHDVGCDADDWLEAARKGSAGFEGAKHALREAAKHVQQIAEVIDQDIENGKLEKLDGPLQIAAYAKKQITRAVDSLTVASLNYGNRQMASQGEIAAYERVLKYLEGKRQEEGAKIERLRQALASGEIQIEEDGTLSQGGNGQGAHLPGVRPSQGIAAQRRAEQDAEKGPPLTPEPEAAAPEPETKPPAAQPQKKLVPKPAKKVTKKRGGRPKGSKNKPKPKPGTTANAPNA